MRQCAQQPENLRLKQTTIHGLSELQRREKDLGQLIIDDEFEEEYMATRADLRNLTSEIQSLATSSEDSTIESRPTEPTLADGRQIRQLSPNAVSFNPAAGFAGNPPIVNMAPATSASPAINSNLDDLIKIMAAQHLSTLKLPTFSGQSADYPNWKQHVEAIIFKPGFLPEARYCSLLDCVSGRAQDLIRNLPYGGDSAKKAFEILDGEYNKPWRIFDDQTNRIKKLSDFNTEKVDTALEFVRTLESVAAALRAAGYQNEIDGELMHRSVMGKLPFRLQDKWLTELERNKTPRRSKLEGLASFLSRDIERRRSLVPSASRKKSADSRKDDNKKKEFNKESRDHINTSTGDKPSNCPLCKGDHSLASCKKFAELEPDQRVEKAKELRVCFRCLYPHSRRQCRKPEGCAAKDPDCKYDHHSLLHGGKMKSAYKKESTTDDSSKSSDSDQSSDENTDGEFHNLAVDYIAAASFNTLRTLRVVPLWVRAQPGDKEERTVALLDNGCSRTVLDEELAVSIGLKLKLQKRALHTVNHSEDQQTAATSFEIRGKDGDWFTVTSGGTRKKLRLPAFKVPLASWSLGDPRLQEMGLEDLNYNNIKIIVGLPEEYLFSPIAGTEVHLNKRNIFGYQTKLGWTVSGDIPVREIVAATFSYGSYDDEKEVQSHHVRPKNPAVEIEKAKVDAAFKDDCLPFVEEMSPEKFNNGNKKPTVEELEDAELTGISKGHKECPSEEIAQVKKADGGSANIYGTPLKHLQSLVDGDRLLQEQNHCLIIKMDNKILSPTQKAHPHSLNKSSFLNKLNKIFFSHHGNPKTIQCGQGASFIGGIIELEHPEKDSLSVEPAHRWKFKFNLSNGDCIKRSLSRIVINDGVT